MREAIKLMLIPIVGCIGIAIIFLFVVWAGYWYSDVVRPDRDIVGKATVDVAQYPVYGITTDCGDIFDPVCGWDDKTYDNACKAINHGTKVQYNGNCR